MKKMNKKGFTIVELVIVIAVIAILASVLIPTFANVVKKANESKVLQAARNAYTNALVLDMADGTKDGYVGEAKSGNEVKFAATAAANTVVVPAGVTVTYTATGTEMFKYVDGDITATMNADGAWTVG